MSSSGTITGTIIGARHYGALVVLFLDAGEGRVVPVLLNQRQFRHALAEEGCSPTELTGRSVRFDGDGLVFLDGG